MSTSPKPSIAAYIAQRLGMPIASIEKLEQDGLIKLGISINLVPQIVTSSSEASNSNDRPADTSGYSEENTSQKHPGGCPPKYDLFRFGVILTKLVDVSKQFATRQELADAALAACEEYAARSSQHKRGNFKVPSPEWIRPLISDFAQVYGYEFKNDST